MAIDFLPEMISLFYPESAELGRFEETPREETPEPYKRLLVHEHHMTVTVEAYHHSLVDVSVLDRQREGCFYNRKIMLSRQSDGAPVQFGLVRLDLRCLPKAAAEGILSEKTPLGRVLIEQNVLRRVRLDRIWRVETGPELTQLFHLPKSQTAYGRTAWIDCNGEQAIELLEIVVPE